ncbi:SDR family oxidoreductase [Mycobacterium sp. 852013-50091_SCH5140682]|uniref:SDR family NAD(P)-dependent oxidoreductase n=1 Tax=Mycobacterium sp. 852013-50091_SCH5140682 TaxID=1834109 RepID=UPI0012EB0154
MSPSCSRPDTMSRAILRATRSCRRSCSMASSSQEIDICPSGLVNPRPVNRYYECMFCSDYSNLAPDVALVTGSTGGIGSAIVTELKGLGMTVVGVDNTGTASGAEDHLITADLVAADMDGLVDEAEAACGKPLDVLVNCAGVSVDTPAEDLRRPEIERVLAVNLVAPIELSIAVGRRMLERGYGRIVNITSIHGRAGAIGCLPYDASKAGLDNATRTMAAEWSRRGVLVNAVAPGFVRTAMCTDERLAQPWFTDGYVSSGRLPLGRAATPDEIARPVAWLASRQNTYITGQVVYADGGLYSTF